MDPAMAIRRGRGGKRSNSRVAGLGAGRRGGGGGGASDDENDDGEEEEGEGEGSASESERERGGGTRTKAASGGEVKRKTSATPGRRPKKSKVNKATHLPNNTTRHDPVDRSAQFGPNRESQETNNLKISNNLKDPPRFFFLLVLEVGVHIIRGSGNLNL